MKDGSTVKGLYIVYGRCSCLWFSGQCGTLFIDVSLVRSMHEEHL